MFCLEHGVKLDGTMFDNTETESSRDTALGLACRGLAAVSHLEMGANITIINSSTEHRMAYVRVNTFHNS